MSLNLNEKLTWQKAKLLRPGDVLQDNAEPRGQWTVTKVERDEVYFTIVGDPRRPKSFSLTIASTIQWTDFTVIKLAKATKSTRRTSKTENQKLLALSHATLVRKLKGANYRINYLVRNCQSLIESKAKLVAQTAQLRQALKDRCEAFERAQIGDVVVPANAYKFTDDHTFLKYATPSIIMEFERVRVHGVTGWLRRS